MDVLVKGMEMPDCCDQCPALDESGDYPYCNFTGEQRGYTFRVRELRMDKCPLQPVEIGTAHGRLIDADALLQSIKESIDECHKWAEEVEGGEMYARVSQSLGTFVECSLRVKAAPTIIPADPAKEET